MQALSSFEAPGSRYSHWKSYSTMYSSLDSNLVWFSPQRPASSGRTSLDDVKAILATLGTASLDTNGDLQRAVFSLELAQHLVRMLIDRIAAGSVRNDLMSQSVAVGRQMEVLRRKVRSLEQQQRAAAMESRCE